MELEDWLVTYLEGKQTDAHEYFAAIQRLDLGVDHWNLAAHSVNEKPSHVLRA